ncbi:amidohydrolase [Kiloniella sp.]|uniref:amidohydrolase n=1 Tax=Kiloniella sp. TaxID=1938587 RepID=UPI003B022DDC
MPSLGNASDNSYLIVNANIYTVDPNMPWAESILVDKGVITAVGQEDKLRNLAEDNYKIVDLGGRMLLPGFQDPHLHALEAGINETACFLPAEGTANTYREEIGYCLKDQGNAAWFLGAGVSMPELLETVDSPMALLDQLIPDRPAVILDNLGHGAWANSKAMQAVGYLDLKADPPGGIIDRDPYSGDLTGVVFENAQQKLRNAALPPTKENIEFAYRSLLSALNVLAENGITTVSDAGGYWPRGHQEAWVRAERENELTVRASNALYLYPDLPFEEQISEFQSRYMNDQDSLLRFNQAKIYIDGILSQATGALYQPYERDLDLPREFKKGFLYFDEETLFKYVTELEASGFQLHFHATGDRGVGLALDALQHAKNINSQSDMRHRITHLYLVADKDVARFQELDVVTDFQLSPSSTNADTKRYLAEIVGNRSNHLMPARRLYEAGVDLVLSSDWDAEELSPLKKIEAVLTQRNGSFDDVATVIELMTINVAKLLHHEDKTGSIEKGKLADFVVLDRNIFNIPVNQIGTTNVAVTLLEGEAIYDPKGLFD